MRSAASVFASTVLVFVTGQAMNADSPPLQHRYQEGETVSYRMNGRNQDGPRTTIYRAQADGVVRKNGQGVFVEEFRWRDLSFNGSSFPLSPASLEFRQQLSLDPKFRLAIPDLSKVQPALIGPIVDLLTFYADMQLAMRQSSLRHTGDHVYVKHGTPNSWADHAHTLLGQDSINFDITLAKVNVQEKTATVVVKHVPPAVPEIKIPAEWMETPVANTRNNWVQVQKEGGKYVASVGQEVFTDRVRQSLTDGKILSTSMDNPVKVLEKDCADERLQNCGKARRYEIERHVEIRSTPSSD